MEPTLNIDPGHAFGEQLVHAGKLSARDLERALAAQQEMGGTLGVVLTQLGLVSEGDVVQTRSRVLGIPFAAAEEFPDIAPEVSGLLPDFMAAHQVYPLRLDGNRLDVAMATPEDGYLLKALRLATGLEIRPFIALPSDIEKALSQPATEAVGPDEDEDLRSGSAATPAISSST